MPNGFVTPYVGNVYDSPNMVRIADLVRQQGADRAAAIQRSGDLSAQTWGNIGNIIQGTVGSLVRQQQEAPKLAAENLAVGEQQKAAQFRSALGDVMKNTPQGNEDGVSVYDIPAISQRMAAKGFGDRLDGVVQHLGGINEAFRAERSAKLALVQRGAQGIIAAGNDPTLATHFLDQLEKNGSYSPEEITHYRDFIAADPANVAKLTAALAGPQKIGFAPAGSTPYNETTGQQAGPTLPEKPEVPTEASLAADAANPKSPTQAQSAAAMRTLKPAQQTTQEWKDVLLDGKPAKVFVDPKTKVVTDLAGNVIDNPVKRIGVIPPASSIVNVGAVDDVKESVAGMMDGTIPPALPGRATKEYLATLAEAHRQGYNLQAAVTDWNATQKHIATLNNAQQTRLNQSIGALPDLLDTVDALASKWKGGRFPVLNRANLALAKGGTYGDDVATVARQLDAQIADVTADLGNVYMGGNSPTDQALGLAAKSLSGDWSEKVLHDMVSLARGNVTIRRNSIKNTGVQGASANNPYAPAAPVAAPTPTATTGAPTYQDYLKSRGKK